MTRIFLKLYGSILIAFIVLFFVSYWVLFGLNANRFSQYQQSMSQSVAILIAEHILLKNNHDRQQWLAALNEQYNISAELFPVDRFPLGRRKLNRLDAGLSVVVTVQKNKVDKEFLLYKLRDQTLLVGLDVKASLADLPNLTAYLLSMYLGRVDSSQYAHELKRIADSFSYPVRLLPRSSLSLSAYQLTYLDQHKTLIDSQHGLDQPVIIAVMPDGVSYLSLGPIQRFDRYPFSLILVIVVLDTLLLGLVAYLLVHPIEKRLKVLAKAANQIKRGHLDVRADVDSVDAIGMLAAAFNAMAEHIQMLLDMQKEMIRAISHELRTPVARMRFSLQMIEDAQSDAERLPLLQGMDGDMEQLDELIDEILTYARMEHATPELQFILLDVDEVIDQVLKEMAPAARKSGVRLEHIPESLPPQHRLVEAEFRGIHRVIQNFVGNAIRYAKSQVRISFLIDGITCKILVEDDGPGVPAEEWEKIFSPFVRLDTSRNRASGGYGLGLSIIRRLVNWHHGRVWVEHSELGGAAFSMEWPVRQPELLAQRDPLQEHKE